MRAAASGPRSGSFRPCPVFLQGVIALIPFPVWGRVAGGRDRVPGCSPAAAFGRVGRSWRPVEPLRLLSALFWRVLAPMPCRQSWSVWRASMARLRRIVRLSAPLGAVPGVFPPGFGSDALWAIVGRLASLGA